MASRLKEVAAGAAAFGSTSHHGAGNNSAAKTNGRNQDSLSVTGVPGKMMRVHPFSFASCHAVSRMPWRI
jgi:hypothetical protein